MCSDDGTSKRVEIKNHTAYVIYPPSSENGTSVSFQLNVKFVPQSANTIAERMITIDGGVDTGGIDTGGDSGGGDVTEGPADGVASNICIICNYTTKIMTIFILEMARILILK